jgi:hypothetical protein
LRLTVSDRTADQSAPGQSADHGGAAAMVTVPPPTTAITTVPMAILDLLNVGVRREGAIGAASAGAQAVPMKRAAIASLLTNVMAVSWCSGWGCGVAGGLFKSAWIGHFARRVLLALIGESRKFALVQHSFDRLGRIVWLGLK